ncbi:MAG: 3-phosphoshikimate 1-carboxyvinyltransferase [Bacteroidales bacterium]|nr:3-phosphoshikimate 1-carboxyvinyltransferase [Bacteroidales bacterium]
MNIKVFPSKVKGTIQAPASKSMLQRAIAASFLSDKSVQIDGFSPSADANAALELLKTLGVHVKIKENTLFIEPNFNPKSKHLTCGESGLGIRLFSPILALYDQQFILQAEGTLQKRPMHLIEKVLASNGAKCSSSNGFAPLHICGPLNGGDIGIDASEGSQLLSGLLMALPKLKNDSTIRVINLKSKPYIDMTISLLNAFGIKINNKDYSRFEIAGNQKYNADKYVVEGDWSGAAFLLVAAAIQGSVQLNNLRMDSLQGDKQIVEVLKQVGAKISQDENSIYVVKRRLKAFVYDATETPDLFPPLAALAASCEGISRINGVHRLIHKESNRAEAIRSIFDQLGLNLRIEGDEMLIEGSACRGGQISSFDDHRMAMMGTVLALNAKNAVLITEAGSINKSYPDFYADMQRIGVELIEV